LGELALELLARPVQGVHLPLAVLDSHVAVVQLSLCLLEALVCLLLLLVRGADRVLEGRLLLLEVSHPCLAVVSQLRRGQTDLQGFDIFF
jgi:hypothetical protein